MQKQEKLEYALNRLINCFYNLDEWPAISVSVFPKTWIHGGKVDDETREAIRYGQKLMTDRYYKGDK